MAKEYLNGYDGYASLTTAHNAELRTWAGNFTRFASVNTSFTDTGARRKLGMFDASGSCGGTLSNNASNTGPGINSTDWNRDGVAITLGVGGVTNTTCSLVLTAVVSSISIDVAKDGDATISFDWLAAGGNFPTETWDES